MQCMGGHFWAEEYLFKVTKCLRQSFYWMEVTNILLLSCQNSRNCTRRLKLSKNVCATFLEMISLEKKQVSVIPQNGLVRKLQNYEF